MENQDQYIPEHLSARWEEASRQLGEASLALFAANQAYLQAIIVRLALTDELKTWQVNTYFNIDL